MLYTPVTLLKQEARFLCPIFFVALRLVDAVPIARVLPVEVLLRHRQGFKTLNGSKPASQFMTFKTI